MSFPLLGPIQKNFTARNQISQFPVSTNYIFLHRSSQAHFGQKFNLKYAFLVSHAQLFLYRNRKTHIVTSQNAETSRHVLKPHNTYRSFTIYTGVSRHMFKQHTTCTTRYHTNLSFRVQPQKNLAQYPATIKTSLKHTLFRHILQCMQAPQKKVTFCTPFLPKAGY